MSSSTFNGHSPGPYVLQSLVEDLPLDTQDRQDVSITCLESWGPNLYVGTSAHEVLHMVQIPPTPGPDSPPKPVYIEAYRLNLPSKHPDAFIKQILVLPNVSKMLVLSSTGLLTFYTIPELAPAFDGATKLKDVLYIGGLDQNEEESEGVQQESGNPQLVMVHAKSKIRLIRVGRDAARLVKDIPIPNSLASSRRGTIACVATSQDYALLDVENVQRIPLFPISAMSETEPVSSGGPPSRVGSPNVTATSLHPPRSSSLTVAEGRERRNSSATAARETTTTAGHHRSVSAGVVRQSPDPEQPDERSSAQSSQQIQPATTAQSASTPRPSSDIRPHTPNVGPSPQAQQLLRPNIASPSSDEFLLTTGTRPDDPGVGMFVNLDGDVTRGTIQFRKYPSQVLVQGPWAIAVIPGEGLEVQRWRFDDEGGDQGIRVGNIFLEHQIQIKEVLELEGTIVADASRILRLVRARLSPIPQGAIDPPSDDDKRRNEEEWQIAQRISTVQSKVVAFSDRAVWTLLPCPRSVMLNARLPAFSDENFDGIVARTRQVLQILKEVQSIQPSTEMEFHEVSYVRQKCGLLVLGELLRITQKQTHDIAADEIMKVEIALIESGLDPRLIVTLFGATFAEDIVEGNKGIWVYGGIDALFKDLKSSEAVGNLFTRDVLLLLKRYLWAWRSKKGFGSIADDKDVFVTVDAALLRALLMLDSPAFLVDRGKTVVKEGNIRTELYKFIDGGVEDFQSAARVLEAFGRLYPLSILYSKAKMYRSVLETWKRILEEGDPVREFQEGEQRVKSYLLKLKEPGVVSEFGCWLAARNPELGVQVFGSEEAKVKFDPPEVLEMLRQHAPDCVRPYVEYLVKEKKSITYSNDLIFLYLDELIEALKSQTETIDSLRTSYESYRALDSPKPTYYEFMMDNSPPQASAPWWHDRMELLKLLGGECAYDVSKVSGIIAPFHDALVPEMVILHGRDSNHASALKLLTHDLKDFDTAINYCLFGGLAIFQTRTPLTDRTEQSRLFTILLDECLRLENLSERVQQTSTLLERFGRWLDVTHVLSVIPETWSVEILGAFLMSALRELVRERAEIAVERALERSVNFRAESRYVEACDAIGPSFEGGSLQP